MIALFTARSPLAVLAIPLLGAFGPLLNFYVAKLRFWGLAFEDHESAALMGIAGAATECVPPRIIMLCVAAFHTQRQWCLPE